MAFDHEHSSGSPAPEPSPADAQPASRTSTAELIEELFPEDVAFEVAFDGCLSQALFASGAPVVRWLKLENTAARPFSDLTVRVGFGPELVPTWERAIRRLPAGSSFQADDVELAVTFEIARKAADDGQAVLWTELVHAGEVLVREEWTLEVLDEDVWAGMRSLPETLAAFVHPRAAALEGVASRAQELLGAELGGYGDPEHTREEIEAVFAACRERGFSSQDTPVGLMASGGALRDAQALTDAGTGTSLDLALFAAAAFERAGLHALVSVHSEAVLVGAWRSDDAFATATFDDVQSLKRRLERGEIVLFDAGLLSDPDAQCSPDRIAEILQDGDAFLFGLDLEAARRAGVRPLGEEEGVAPQDGGSGASWAQVETDSPERRIETWKRRLLDLTLRNRFLNFVASRKTIALRCPDVETLYETLAEGDGFEVLGRSRAMASGGERSQKDDTAYLNQQLKSGKLRTLLETRELSRRLLELYRAARMSVEETGANVLYLAVGFLRWDDTGSNERALRAPLLLLPLTLERLSMKKGYRIRLADEEPRVNVTLLEKLGSEYGIDVEALRDPHEEDGSIDVGKVLKRWRAAIKARKGWEILPDACIGLFSFTKFLMWRDLEALGEALREHPVLRYLIDRPDTPFDEAPFPAPERLDERRPDECLLPMDADSSQIAAVVAAEEGKSFVLEGPPGTGKSQTITNLIAHCLARGKRVLFVAEKKAALSVVQDRLVEVGLGPFCLELHSNKSNKKEVLDQLRETLDVAATPPPDGWDDASRRLEQLRAQLNGYVEALHGERPLGRSVRRVIERQLALRDAPLVELALERPEAVTAEDYATVVELVDALACAAGAIGDPANHPLKGVLRLDWDRELPQAITALIEDVRSALVDLEAALARTGRLLGLSDEGTGEVMGLGAAQLEALQHATQLFLQPSPPAGLIEVATEERRAQIRAWMAHAQTAADRRAQLESGWDESFLGADVAALRERLERVQSASLPLRAFKARKLRRELASYGRGVEEVDLAVFAQGLSDLQELGDAEQEGQRLGAELVTLFGADWSGFQATPETLERELVWCESYQDLLSAVVGEEPRLRRQVERRWAAIAEDTGGIRGTQGFAVDLQGFGIALGAFREAWTAYVQRIHLDEEAVVEPARAGFLTRVREHLQGWEERTPELRDWLLWQRARNAAAETWAAPIVDALERGAFEADKLGVALERSFGDAWLRRTLEEQGPMGGFHGVEHTRKVQRFRELDAEWIQVTRGLLRAKLGARIAYALRESACAGEIGLLERELRKKRRVLPVRRLFESLPNLLPRLKPCVLMSPLAAAQYLDADLEPFDLVVFDEASQIPIWDAVGAIARGKQVIVVGDSRQLPPTNFFSSIEEDEDLRDDEIEELDSLLEECVASRLPSLQLRWHYRSRHESLIAFSNERYYANRLVTFPSPSAESEELGVRFRYVEGGVHDRGDTATNRPEAEAIVREALAVLLQPRKKGDPEPSLGIVTFSLPQQRLVEELLEEARSEHARIDPWFTDAAREPVFVKNLESVQGDERDVILLGVGFGPDSRGRFSMNFGPLCRDGGERRLNVAITRARRRLVLFSSLRAADIDLARTQAIGAKHLKAFLDYAENGGRAVAPTLARESEHDISPAIEADLCACLQARGWSVDRDVGCSEFRLDMAIRHPRDPSRYVLGLECDGESYRRAATARDRDRLRSGVLNELGWSLHRVWAPDWWQDPEREVERVEAAVEVALQSERGVPRVRVRRAG